MHDVALAAMYGAVERLAPKLESLALVRIDSLPSPFDEEEPFWNSLGRLQHLVIDYDNDVPTILATLPAPLLRLRIRPPFDTQQLLSFNLLLEALCSSRPSLRRLKHLVPPFAEAEQDTRASPQQMQQMEAERSAIVFWCRQRGVQVIHWARYRGCDEGASMLYAMVIW